MKTFRVELTSGEARTVLADQYRPAEDFRSGNPTGFMSFTTSPDPHEVLAIRTDQIVSIEEIESVNGV